MIDSKLSDEMIAFLDGILRFYSDFLALETQKYDDVAKGNLKTLSSHMTKEQAFVLKTKGLDLERQALMEKAGVPQATLNEAIPLFSAEKQAAVRDLRMKLLDTAAQLKLVNANCNRLIQIKLGHISKVLSVLNGQPETKQLYGASAKCIADGSHFSEKI